MSEHRHMSHRLRTLSASVSLAAVMVAAAATGTSVAAGNPGHRLHKIKHVVVIYEENHSFDNLYGGWGGVRGLADADSAHNPQGDQSGVGYGCLKQDDGDLTSPPLPPTGTD